MGEQMGLADAIHNEFDKVQRRICHLGRIVRTMPDDDRDALAAAVDKVRAERINGGVRNSNSMVTAAAIRRALVAEGYTVSKDTVEKHVAGTCGCEQ